ncbi:hypothetical protein CBOM_05662 [Ceraceosorus bombacis]|uniref:Uncharacterized protein n=1 Tax=Ceraceosorus bombacis TaxID=401625 RepID=A0A0P1BPY6_9BASI|nr:hypothetical protein CBOM_05662 [Ceraceosorus bombacis]
MPLTRAATAAAERRMTPAAVSFEDWVNKRQREGLSQSDLPDLMKHRDAVTDSFRHLWVKMEVQEAEEEVLRKQLARLKAQLAASAQANVVAAAAAFTQIRAEDTAGGSEESSEAKDGGGEDSEEAEAEGSQEAVTDESVEAVTESSVEESSVEVEAAETAETGETEGETETGDTEGETETGDTEGVTES